MSSDWRPRVPFKLLYPVTQSVAHKCLARALLKGLFKKSLLRICQQISTECLISVANLRKVHPKKVVRNPQYIGNLGLHFTIFHPISPSPVLSHIAEEPCEIGKIITVDKGLGARVA